MEDTTVFIKTNTGREEIKTRERKLPSNLRSLLIAVDGIKSVASLSREYPVPGGILPLLRALRDEGLIERANGQAVTPTNTIEEPAPEQYERFRRATQFLNEASALLGLSGYFFSLRIQRCATIAELRALGPDLRSAVAKRRGDRDVEELMRKFHDVVG